MATPKLRLPCPYLHLSLSQGMLQLIHGELEKIQVALLDLGDTCSYEGLVPKPSFSAYKSDTVKSRSTSLLQPGITLLPLSLREQGPSASSGAHSELAFQIYRNKFDFCIKVGAKGEAIVAWCRDQKGI